MSKLSDYMGTKVSPYAYYDDGMPKTPIEIRDANKSISEKITDAMNGKPVAIYNLQGNAEYINTQQILSIGVSGIVILSMVIALVLVKKGKTSISNIIRWLLCIPAYLIGYVIIRAIGLFCLSFAAGIHDGILYYFAELFMEGIVATGGGLYVIYGLAPSNKINATIIFAAISSIICFASLVAAIIGHGFYQDFYKGFATLTLAIITNICVAYTIVKGEQEKFTNR